MVVVSDTSPISNLYVIGQLNLLHELYSYVVIPTAVFAELNRLSDFGYDIEEIVEAEWILRQMPEDSVAVSELARRLDLGESEAIVLIKELEAELLLIDERRGWKIANSLGIKTIGVLGILLLAKQKGLISYVRPLLDDLQDKAGFFIRGALRREVLKLAGE
jgi:uncharacterized protein